MTGRERALYHQIHPLKLLTDWGAAAAGGYALWQHRLGLGIGVGLAPPVLVSVVFMTGSIDLESYKTSAFGRYIAQYMTGAMQGLRLFGVALLWLAAWRHQALLMGAGLLIILAAWGRGKLWPSESGASR